MIRWTLTDARKEKKLSVKQLADQIGFGEHQLRKYEKGQMNPGLNNAEIWARSLGFDLTLVRR